MTGLPHATVDMFGRLKRHLFCFLLLKGGHRHHEAILILILILVLLRLGLVVLVLILILVPILLRQIAVGGAAASPPERAPLLSAKAGSRADPCAQINRRKQKKWLLSQANM